MCPVSAPSLLNAYGKEKFLNIPCTAFCKGCPSSWEPSRPGTTKAVWGTWGYSPKYKDQRFWGFLELLLGKDLQTGQSSVLHHVTWEDARLLKVSPRNSWVLLPPWAAAVVPWKSPLQAARGSLYWVLFGMAVKLQKRI